MPNENRYSLTKIIIFGIVILVLAALIGFYFINKKNTTSQGSDKGKNPFPYGQGTATSPTGSGTAPGNATLENIGENPLTVTDGARLRHITDYPVTGFLPQTTNRAVSEPKLDEKTKQTKLVTTLVPMDTVRFNAKQNGFLIDADMSRDAIIVQQKTKTTVPDAEEIWFGSAGNAVTYRTWSAGTQSISSLVGTLPITTQSVAYCALPLTLETKKGMKGPEVAELQRYLAEKLSITVTADGSFGTKTGTLLKSLQKTLGIPETGITDQATRDIINADCTSIQTALSKASREPLAFSGKLLPENILRGTISPDGKQMFFLKETGDGTIGVVANSDGTNQKQIFISPVSEWQPLWVNPNVITMTTLASREADGYLYFLNPENGAFKKILGPARGLTTLTSPDAKTVLYSASTDRGFITKTYRVDTGVEKNLDLVTLPEKCAWQDSAIVLCGVPRTITSNQYPDAWYQGLMSFTDSLWSINTVQGSTNILVSPEQSFDTTKLQVSPGHSYLYFMNKTDGTLWSYRLSE